MIGRYLELVFYRAWAELRSEVARVYLGVVWWVLEPILYISVFYLVFGLGFRQGDEGFVEFLLCGLVPWKWLDGTVRAASGSVSGSVGLMQQVYIPKILLPLIVITTNTFKFLIILSLLLVFLWFDGAASYETWVYLPLVLAIHLLMVFAMSVICACIVPFVPDLKFVVTNGMTMLFFMSGIFYKVEYMSQDIQDILMHNPVLVILQTYRDVLLYGRAPDMGALMPGMIEMSCFAVMAIVVFRAMDRRYPRVVG